MLSRLIACSLGHFSGGRVSNASAAAALSFGSWIFVERMLKISTSFFGTRPRQKREAF